MTKPTLLLLPKVNVPQGSANDYACGSYNGNKNFSCKPYGSLGNIDSGSSSDGWGSAIVSGIVGSIIGSVVGAIIT